MKSHFTESRGPMGQFIDLIRSLPRGLKRAIMVGYDACVLFLVGWIAANWFTHIPTHAIAAALASTAAGISVILISGGYTSVVRFMGRSTGIVFAVGTVVAALTWATVISASSIGIFYGVAGFFLLFSPRFALREMDFISHKAGVATCRVAIYGAGKAGRQLAWSLRADARYHPVIFIDDSHDLQGLYVQGLKVFAPDNLSRLLARFRIEQVFFAIPSATHDRRGAILAGLADQAIKVQTIPQLHEIIDGNIGPASLRPLEMEDILNRDPVPADPVLLRFTIENKIVMVSGAGGSIGSELCRTVMRLRPKALVLFEMSEPALYQIEQELLGMGEQMTGSVPALHPILGSVLDLGALNSVFKAYQIDTVFHAAAYKHVPLLETNVIEGVSNNVFGTKAIIEEAVHHKVSTFVFISTDKAVRPTNVMGASKRVAEMIAQAYGEVSDCRISIVRFGNVLGSSGSVLPMFKAQIAKGGPITVTHPEITRFFMTIPEAAQLVIQAGALGGQGDIYHLDMGQPVRIIELARRLLNLYGMRERTVDNETGVKIAITGLRPGEKLYEELLIDDTARPTSHPRIFGARERCLSMPEINMELRQLLLACNNRDAESVISCLQSMVEGFKPYPRVWVAKRGDLRAIRRTSETAAPVKSLH